MKSARNATMDDGIGRNLSRLHEEEGEVDGTGYSTLALATWWVYRVIDPVVVIFGIGGNLLNLAVLWSSKLRRTVAQVFLRGLAVADFCAMVLRFAFLIISMSRTYLDTTYLLAWYNAHVFLYLFNSFACASNLLVMVVTLDRWISLRWPLPSFRWRTFCLARFSVAAIYAVTFLLQIPECFQYNVGQWIDVATNRSFYSADWNYEIHKNKWYSHVWPWTVAILFRIIPIVCVLFLNPLIIKFYRRKVREATGCASISDTCRQQHEIDEREELRLTLMLVTVSVVFVFCTSPMAVLVLVDRMVSQETLTKNTPYEIFRLVANLLEIVNMAVNFYLYNVSSVTFRKACREMFGSMCRSAKTDEGKIFTEMVSVKQTSASFDKVPERSQRRSNGSGRWSKNEIPRNVDVGDSGRVEEVSTNL